MTLHPLLPTQANTRDSFHKQNTSTNHATQETLHTAHTSFVLQHVTRSRHPRKCETCNVEFETVGLPSWDGWAGRRDCIYPPCCHFGSTATLSRMLMMRNGVADRSLFIIHKKENWVAVDHPFAQGPGSVTCCGHKVRECQGSINHNVGNRFRFRGFVSALFIGSTEPVVRQCCIVRRHVHVSRNLSV